MGTDEEEVTRIRDLVDAIDRSDYAGVADMLQCSRSGGPELQSAIEAAFIRAVRPLLRVLDEVRPPDATSEKD